MSNAARPDLFPNVSYGTDERDVEWRNSPLEDIDDEELDETPSDVVELLGFDPKDINDTLVNDPPRGAFADASERRPIVEIMPDGTVRVFARTDAEFNESDHPRAPDAA